MPIRQYLRIYWRNRDGDILKDVTTIYDSDLRDHARWYSSQGRPIRIVKVEVVNADSMEIIATYRNGEETIK